MIFYTNFHNIRNQYSRPIPYDEIMRLYLIPDYALVNPKRFYLITNMKEQKYYSNKRIEINSAYVFHSNSENIMIDLLE